MSRYALLVTVNGADIVSPAWRETLLALVEGRDEESDGQGTSWFNRYVLLGTEDECRAIVAVNANVPQAVRNRLSQDSAFWQLIEFSETKAREELESRLRQFAREQGYSHFWAVVAGSQITPLNLLSRFAPL